MCPHLGTVTYLTSHGGPTVVVDRASPEAAGGAIQGAVRRASLCYPQELRHLSFDGRLLHGATSDLLIGQEGAPQQGQRRVTFLANVWLNHVPHGTVPLPKERHAAGGSAGVRVGFAEAKDAQVEKLEVGGADYRCVDPRTRALRVRARARACLRMHVQGGGMLLTSGPLRRTRPVRAAPRRYSRWTSVTAAPRTRSRWMCRRHNCAPRSTLARAASTSSTARARRRECTADSDARHLRSFFLYYSTVHIRSFRLGLFACGRARCRAARPASHRARPRAVRAPAPPRQRYLSHSAPPPSALGGPRPSSRASSPATSRSARRAVPARARPVRVFLFALGRAARARHRRPSRTLHGCTRRERPLRHRHPPTHPPATPPCSNG